MLRTFLFGLFLALPGVAAQAECTGTSLLGTMPADDRAALEAAVAQVPYARGNSWLARRDGKVIHIVGTYHFDDQRHDAVLERLSPAIDAAAMVLVEAGPEEEARLQAETSRNPALLFLTEGPTLPEQLSEEDWQALATAMKARGVPAFLASKMRPWYVSMLLGVPPCAMAELTGGKKGLDARVIARAKAQSVPVRALEPYDTVFKLFDEMTVEEKLDMIRTALATGDQAEDYSATLSESYFNEDVRAIWEIGRLFAYDMPGKTTAEVDEELALMEEAMMKRRNRAWIPVIEAAAEEGPVFVAFGALHLSGEEGVLALLEREGFELERLPF